MTTETRFGHQRFAAGRPTLPPGWSARLLSLVKTVSVVCGLAAIPFAADLASEVHVRGASAGARTHALPVLPGSAVIPPRLAPALRRS